MNTRSKLESALSKVVLEAPKAEIKDAKLSYGGNWYGGHYHKGWWLECHVQQDFYQRFLGNAEEAECFILGEFRNDMKHIHNLVPDPVTIQIGLRAESKEGLLAAVENTRLAFTIIRMNEPHFANQRWCIGIVAAVGSAQS